MPNEEIRTSLHSRGDLKLKKILRKKIGRIGRKGLTVEERKLAVSLGVIPG